MVSLRDLVTGADGCTPGDGAGPSNAAGALVNAILGGRDKQQQQLHEVGAGASGAPRPRGAPRLFTLACSSAHPAAAAPQLPGAGARAPGLAAPFRPPTAAEAAAHALGAAPPPLAGFPPGAHADVEAFLRSGMGGAMMPPPPGAEAAMHADFERIYGRPGAAQALPPFPHAGAGFAALPPGGEGAAAAVRPALQAFFDAGRAGGAHRSPPPPGAAGAAAAAAAALGPAGAARIRDRSTILARQVFTDRGAGHAEAQVAALLSALAIEDPGAGFAAAGPGAGAAEWERIYGGGAAAAADAAARAAAPRGWAAEYAAATPPPPQRQQQQRAGDAWAEDYSAAAAEAVTTPGSAWADEFRVTAAAGGAARDAAAADAREQTRRLSETLSNSADPKMRNSRFAQFVTKMSRGEAGAAGWANEFAAAGAPGAAPAAWAEEFGAARPGGGWAEEHLAAIDAAQAAGVPGAAEAYAAAAPRGGDWAGEFAAGVADGWAEEFSAMAEGAPGVDVAAWEAEYAAELERLHSEAGPAQSAG
jgi:peroxin-5